MRFVHCDEILAKQHPYEAIFECKLFEHEKLVEFQKIPIRDAKTSKICIKSNFILFSSYFLLLESERSPMQVELDVKIEALDSRGTLILSGRLCSLYFYFIYRHQPRAASECLRASSISRRPIRISAE
jgi:hypothetical protein